MKSTLGQPMTLRNAAAAACDSSCGAGGCQHQVEPDPAEMAARDGAETGVLERRDRLVCARCRGREVDMVVSGTERRPYARSGRKARPRDRAPLSTQRRGDRQISRRRPPARRHKQGSQVLVEPGSKFHLPDGLGGDQVRRPRRTAIDLAEADLLR